MTDSADNRRLGLSWAFASAFGAALMVIPWKLANEIGQAENSVLVLLFVAALCNSALLVGQRVAGATLQLRIRRIEFLVAALLATFTLAGNLASGIAVQDLSAALLNVLLRTDVLFVAIFGWFLLGERVEGRFWIGALIAVGGLVVLQGPLGASGLQGLLESGTGMAIASAACFSLLAIITRRFIHRIDPVAVNAIRLWFAVLLWFPVYGLPELSSFPREQILYATLAGIVGPFLGRLALMISARHVEARMTTLATLSAPILTLLPAYLLLNDWPEPHQLLGGAIMMSGIAIPLLTLRSKRPA